MKIGELSRAAGVSASAIRYYESSGIMKRPPRRNGVRDYDASALDELRLVSFYRSCGVSIGNLTTIFTTDSRLRRQNAHAAIARRMGELDGLITQARAMKRRLRALQACACDGDRRRCVVFKPALREGRR